MRSGSQVTSSAPRSVQVMARSGRAARASEAVRRASSPRSKGRGEIGMPPPRRARARIEEVVDHARHSQAARSDAIGDRERRRLLRGVLEEVGAHQDRVERTPEIVPDRRDEGLVEAERRLQLLGEAARLGDVARDGEGAGCGLLGGCRDRRHHHVPEALRAAPNPRALGDEAAGAAGERASDRALDGFAIAGEEVGEHRARDGVLGRTDAGEVRAAEVGADPPVLVDDGDHVVARLEHPRTKLLGLDGAREAVLELGALLVELEEDRALLLRMCGSIGLKRKSTAPAS